ncbi:chromosome segregation protein SMC, partial [bacterium]|nr:chromosome segregation protein SMC [bacterium]
MFFKRIEMTGFKSFATKTVVDFQSGVTVVVGPNGCGKSNIFDAIRWVLGEQSAKSLRGTKMGDVIFQGSATYKPMGCAQVSLVINNEDSRLPIDYSEVSLTRRLYRSGESEYAINKIPCRLRDIHELFLDTGVGTESYSIMEQGRVDDIVKSRPEDRRELFEEAAGISKYKARKAEALRKLERTEHDLIRLADRIAESRTRTISLKRAASKAERYKSLRDAADLVEKKLLSADLRTLSADFEKIQKAFHDAEERLDVVRAQNSAVEARRADLLLKIERADALLRDLSQQKEDQRQYIHDAATEALRLKHLAEAERQRAQDFLKQIDDNSLRKDEITANLAEINAEEARISVRQIALEAKQNIRRAEYERLRADTDSTRDKIRELRKALESSTSERERLQNEQTRLQMQVEQAGSFIEDFQRQSTEQETVLERMADEIESKKQLLQQSEERLKELQESLNRSQNEGMTEFKARDTLRAEHRQVERLLDDARSRHGALERLARDYEGYYQGVKAVMLASVEHRLDGVIGVVPELVQSINSEHDVAIEVALGNHTQDIVVRNDGEAKRAIEFLKSSRQGQATFLPLNVLEGFEGGRGIDEVLGRPGVVGLASRLVTYDQYIQKAVFNLLGRTIVTEHLDISMRLIRDGKRNRYVTLEGELTFPSGAMTGGSRRQSQIMSRQREITDLASKVEELTASEADFSRRIRKREESMVAIEAQCAKMREQIQEMKLQIGQGKTELTALSESRRQRAALFEDLKNRAESSRTDSDRHGRDLADLTARLGEAQGRIGKQREDLALMEEAVYERNSEVDALGDHVSQVDQEIAHLSARSSHLRENALSLHNQRQNMSRRETQLLNDRQRSLESSKGYVEQSARVESEKAELEKEVAGLDEKRLTAAKEKEESQQANHRESDQASRLYRELNEVTTRHSETQAEFVNTQAMLRQLRDKARERFHSTVEDIAGEMGEVEEMRTDLLDELENLNADLALI